MEALEAEGVRVTERVGMVPRVWKFGKSLRKRKHKRSGRKPHERVASGTSSRGSPLRSGSAVNVKKASSLLRQMSLSGMEGSVISQAGTGTESDSELDIITAGLRHQGEDILNEDDRFDSDDDDSGSDSGDSYIDHVLRRSGTTMVGASITKGPELEKYLRTKVERMGHLLTLPLDQPNQPRRRARCRCRCRCRRPPVSQPNSEDEADNIMPA